MTCTRGDRGNPRMCEPAQSKRTWTFHKSYFVWKFTGKKPHTSPATSIEHHALTLFGKSSADAITDDDQ